MKKLIIGSLFSASFFVSALVFAVAPGVTVTPATGGSAISADTVGGAYTSLTGPVITESNAGDIGVGTIILNAPSGFQFDTAGTAPTVKITRTSGGGADSKNINGAASGTNVSVTSVSGTQITFTVATASNGGVNNSLTWQNLRVRPSVGTPLANGSITKTGTSSFVNPSGTYGSLVEVAGTLAAVISASPASPIEAAASTTLTITLKDSQNNLPADGTAVTVNSTFGTVTGSGTTVSGVVTRMLSASAVGTATLSISGVSVSGDTVISFQDTTAPVLSSPSNVSADAAGPSGATVTYTAPTAIDIVDGPVSVSCVPASGSTFAIGTTPVNCSATDAHGNTGASSFNVIVSDMTAPVLVLPASAAAEATGASGATVAFVTSATDIVDGPVSVSCVPASGSTFAIGITNVSCTATDSASNVSAGSFDVTVADTTAPSIATLPDMTISLASPVATFALPVATDAVDAAPSVSCVPASGSTFSAGMTTVTCTATDHAAVPNSATSAFVVTVADAPAPSISPVAGAYSSIQSVTLDASGATSIRYTDNGMAPTCSSGTVYGSPFALIASKTIKAVACYGSAPSEITSAAYVINLEGTAADFPSFIANGVFIPASGFPMSATPSVTVTQNVTVHITTGLGTAAVVIPAGTVITAADGSNFDGNALGGEDAILAPLSNLASVIYINGALQWGIPSFGLDFSPAITIRIPVKDAADGTALTVYRSVTGKGSWTDEGIASATCSVSGGACSFSATKASYYVATSVPSGSLGSGAGGSSGSGSPSSASSAPAAPAAPAGQVLGVSVSCGKYLNSYLKMGGKNDSAEVKKLQQFLNGQGFKVAVTGTYGSATRAAVMAFQKANKDEVLAPWAKYGVSQEGTGVVYKTTQRLINNMQCPALGLPVPSVE